MDVTAIIARAEAWGIRFEVADGELYVTAAADPGPEALAFCDQHEAAILDYMGKSRVYLDFETASRLDLTKAGSLAYAEDPSTRVLILSFAVGGGPLQTWRPWQAIPADLRHALDAGATVVAHNAGFDRAIWQRHQEPLGWPVLPWSRWSDTSARARVARFPGALGRLAKALKLSVQKDDEGKRLMLKLSRECFAGEGGREPTPTELDRLAQYGVIDTAVMREADGPVPELDAEAAAIAEMDAAMNARGMPVDVEAVRKLIVVRDREDARLTREIATVTNGVITRPTQVQRIEAFLADHDIQLPDCTGETLEAWLADNPERDDVAARVIRNRLEFASAAGAKLDAIMGFAAASGVVRGGFTFHGAHTGRWSSHGVQLQNLPREALADTEATLARLVAAAETGLPVAVPDNDPDAKLSIKDQIAGCIRGLFLAPEGYDYVSVDLSQIESRVLAWLAGQEDKLDRYRAGEDIYIPTAAMLGSTDRKLGKLMELSAGFAISGAGLLKKAPAFGVTLTLVEANSHIDKWRRANPRIVAYWGTLHHAMRMATNMSLGAGPLSAGLVTVGRDEDALRVWLPSGRPLVYRNPRMELGKYGIELTADLPKEGRIQPVGLWRGHCIENVVQAIAYDAMAEKMLQLHREGVPIVGTIHDEIVAVVPVKDAERVRQRMIEVMCIAPAWAPGLPLNAEGFINRRFIEPPKETVNGHVAAAPPAGDGAKIVVRAPEPVSPEADHGTGSGPRPRNRGAALGLGKAVDEGEREASIESPVATLTWPERIENYRATLRLEPYLEYNTKGQRPWLHGNWVLGYYKVKSGYYGGYPGNYLKRVRSLFPDKRSVLHVCSGKVDLSIMPGDTVDILPERNPTFCVDAQTMQGVPLERYDLVLVDPPYDEEHAKRYGTKMPSRARILRALEGLRPGAHVVWLDVMVPKYRKAVFVLEGVIGLVPSTNRKGRVISIFRRLRVAEDLPSARAPVVNPRISTKKARWQTDAALKPTPKRDGTDLWPTPRCLALALVHDVLSRVFAVLGGRRRIWECAEGNGDLVLPMREAGLDVKGSDIATGTDFLTCEVPPGVKIIVTNPPNNQHSAFIERCLRLLDAGEIDAVALLFRLDYLQSESDDEPHCRLEALDRGTIGWCRWRVRWKPGSKGNPRWSFHWVLWIRGEPGGKHFRCERRT